MNHNKYQKMLVPFLDNTLDAARREQLERHLTDCQSCMEELKTMENLMANIKEPPPEEMDREMFRHTLDVTRNVFFQHRKDKEKRMKRLPAMITILSVILFFTSNLFSLRLLASGFSPLRTILAMTLIGSQIVGVLFFLLIFFFKNRFANQINGFNSHPKKSF